MRSAMIGSRYPRAYKASADYKSSGDYSCGNFDEIAEIAARHSLSMNCSVL